MFRKAEFMRKFFKLLFNSKSSYQSKLKNQIFSVSDFTKLYFDSLQISFPDCTFSIVDERTIESVSGDNIVSTSVDNAYLQYQADPDSLEEILNRYISSASDIFVPQEPLRVENIIPVIKPTEYLYNAKDIQEQIIDSSITFNGVYEPYNDQLIIAYAQDSKNSIKYISQDDLRQLSVSPELLKTIAVSNLDKLLTSIKKHGGEGVYMLVAGGDYEASIILLPNILTKENFDVKGDLVIAIPNRDLLLLTGSEDVEGIEKIRNTAKESFRSGTYPLSEYLYKWNGQHFQKFE